MIGDREKEIQEKVINFLNKINIMPFSVIFTYGLEDGGTLSITFWIKDEIDELLEKINYRSICDKNGYMILEENNTVLISGFALMDFYSKISQDE